ncbi:hypothetical protein AB0454_22985 [Streptomyces sp. NPDC093509]|uniref:hypothetical protein n=1 Tax=Streptomyces sp. NPDC093509 TaxID=3154982 RepID=UPI00344D20C8
MSIQPYTTTETLGFGRRWLMNTFGSRTNETITVDLTAFDETLHWTEGSAHQPQRKLKSGIPLGYNTTTKLYEPYSPVTNEVQTATITGGPTGGTFTLTFSGQTTTALAYNATAAAVQTALEALSNVNPGDIKVTGNAGGPYTLTFGGQYLGDNVASATATASFTGGTSPGVTMATTTAGGTATASDGTQKFAGFLYAEVAFYPGETKSEAALMVHGQVNPKYLPVAFDPADVPAGSNTQIIYKTA